MSGNSALDMMMKQKMYQQMGMDSSTAALMAMQGQGDKNDSSMMTMMALSGGMSGAGGAPNSMMQTMMTAKMLESSGVNPTVAFMQAQMMQQQGHQGQDQGRRRHEIAQFGRQTFCNAYSAGSMPPVHQTMMPPQYGSSFTSQYPGYHASQGMPPVPTAPTYGGYLAPQGMPPQSSAPYAGYPQGSGAPTQFSAPQAIPQYMPATQYSAPAASVVPPSRPRYGFIG